MIINKKHGLKEPTKTVTCAKYVVVETFYCVRGEFSALAGYHQTERKKSVARLMEDN